MKYRSVGLNDVHGGELWHYSLVKYNPMYAKQLSKLREMNYELADLVEQCPNLSTDDDGYQCYMIFREDSQPVGAVVVDRQLDTDSLQLIIQINDKCSSDTILDITNRIVSTLGAVHYDKDSIEIKINNDIDLSKEDCQYDRIEYPDGLVTYVFSNQKNSVAAPKLIDEISDLETFLANASIHFKRDLSYYNNNLHGIFDKDLIDGILTGSISLNDFLFRINPYCIVTKNKDDTSSTYSFYRDGKVKYIKINPHIGRRDYEARYYLQNDFFMLEDNYNKIKYENDDDFLSLKSGNIECFKHSGEKVLRYHTPIIDNTSVTLELRTTADDGIEKCYVNFNFHKSNGNIKGQYCLRLLPRYGSLTFNYTSRSGTKEVFSKDALLNGENLDPQQIDDYSLGQVNDLILTAISFINSNADGAKRLPISLEHSDVLQKAFECKEESLDNLVNLVNQIPLTHLNYSINNYVNNMTDGLSNEAKKLVNSI